MNNRLLAVVNTDALLLLLLQEVLENDGYQVTPCLLHAATFTDLRSAAAAVIVVDVGMRAAEGGLTLVRQLRSDAQLQHTPVVLASVERAFVAEHGAELAALAAAVLTIPEQLNALSPTIQSVLERNGGARGAM